MIRIKVCGITNDHDASMAVELGADALGFIFASSPRQVAPEVVREIIRGLPPFVQTVGVFVNEDPAAMRRIMDFCRLDLVQLHGDESPEICDEFFPKSIKAVSMKDPSILKSLKAYRGKVRAFVLDSYSDEKRGGTGRIFDWAWAKEGKDFGLPIILAGGLSPSNLEQAISLVRPFAVDVNSGVEERPGKKSSKLMKDVMEILNGVSLE